MKCTCLSLGCGRKLEYPKTKHSGPETTCKLHTEKLQQADRVQPKMTKATRKTSFIWCNREGRSGYYKLELTQAGKHWGHYDLRRLLLWFELNYNIKNKTENKLNITRNKQQERIKNKNKTNRNPKLSRTRRTCTRMVVCRWSDTFSTHSLPLLIVLLHWFFV